MFRKMLKKDFIRNKATMITLFMFIAMAAFLTAGAGSIIAELTGSIDALFDGAEAPHYMQMHSGSLDQNLIDQFAAENEKVSQQQTIEMVNASGSAIRLGKSGQDESQTVMDIGFVTQAEHFDFLLDLENKPAAVNCGEIGIPVYYMQRSDLEVGDKVYLKTDRLEIEFTITVFTRDAQMNTSFASSKRFLVHQDDWNILKDNIDELEYLIEFQLHDTDLISEFSNDYQNSPLPQSGTAVTLGLFKLLNGLTDGITAAVIIMTGLLLAAIAILCLRFTILAAIAEDYREIGVMKAIGISAAAIRKLYLTKYAALSAIASLTGGILALFMSRIFTANITLYMGTGRHSLLNYLIPFAGAGIICLIVILICRFILRRFKKISARQAMQEGDVGDAAPGTAMAVKHNRFLHMNLFLGIKDVAAQKRSYLILGFIFILCTFIIIVPVNLLNTLQAPDFITYMGLGKSDIRFDLQQDAAVAGTYEEILETLAADPDIRACAGYTSGKYKIKNAEGEYQNVNVETGDFSVFPVEYMDGEAPTKDTEIALSYLNARELDKQTGDTISLLKDGREIRMTVTGIYQDITNGGLTAKAGFTPEADNILWYVINADIVDDSLREIKIAYYQQQFNSVSVVDTQDFLTQTLGNVAGQLKIVVFLAILIALVVSALITALFIKMMTAKDAKQIAVLKILGFRGRDIRLQYITRSLFVLQIGVIIGTAVSAVFGPLLVSAAASSLGSGRIQFVINPVTAYILCPLLLAAAVTLTTLAVSHFLTKDSSLRTAYE